MTKISLRAYIQEINQLIDNKNIADAIEHCKHILKQFPKHLEIYRLLGQAYLESGDYEEAADMFLRVLSVTPDDFIAQVGLSMIMEEQGDSDSAIWHMERAYEVRNTQAIHEELHRLYLLRDGAAPAKPMITRGALIRINIRSGLYQQALQEIQRALSSDPSRIDLKILEARIHYMQANVPKTIRTCEGILKKLPYSYEANSLMAEIHGEAPEGERYKGRLYELNPYTSFVTENNTIDSVPDNVLRIEKLNLEDAYQDDFHLDANSIQFGDLGQVNADPESTLNAAKTDRIKQNKSGTLNDSVDEDGIDLPDFLTNDETSTFEDSTMLEAESEDGNEIPDWMKQAGWGAAEDRTIEEQQGLIQGFDDTVDKNEAGDLISEEVVESDIPDWLQTIAPESNDSQDPEFIEKLPGDEIPQDEENLEWLNDILTTDSEEQPQEPQNQDFESFAGEIQQTATSEEEQPQFGEDIDKDLAWLQDITSPEEKEKGEKIMEDNIFNDDLFEDETTSEEPENMEPETLPEIENLPQLSDSEAPVDFASEPMGSEPDSDPLSATETSEEEEDFDIDSALSWLEGLAAKQGADEEALSTIPEDRIEDKPGFLATDSAPETISAEQTLIDEPTDIISEPVQEYKPELEEIPDWLQEENAIKDFDISEPVEQIENNEFDALPETLATDDLVEDTQDEIAPPSWLKAVAPPEKIQEEEIEDDAMITTEDGHLPAEEDLSIPAEKLGNRASDHPTMALDFIKDDQKEEKEGDIDEWLKNLPDMDWDMDESQEDVQASSETDEPEQLSSVSEEPQPEFEQAESSLEKDTEFIDKLFDSTSETEDEQDEPGSPYVWENEFSNKSEIADEEPIPDWISDIAEEDLTTETPASEPVQEMPEEFQETEKSMDEPQAQVEPDFSIEEMSDDEMPDWMLDTSEIEIQETVQNSETQKPEEFELSDSELPAQEEFVTAEDMQAYSESTSVESDEASMDDTINIPASELEEMIEEDKHIAEETKEETTPTAPTVQLQETVAETPEQEEEFEEVMEVIVAETETETETETEEIAPQVESVPAHEVLTNAKEDLINGDFEEAHIALENLLAKKTNTDEIIETLKFDIENYHPIQVDSWVLLGDAYLQKGDLEKALDAYTKAEDFIY